MIPEGLRPGIQHFNAGEWFEAHEAWEDHWGSGGPAERDATLGLIKAAVALHHLAAGNEPGFLWQAKESIPRLRAHAHLWPELGLDALAEALDSLAAQTRYHGKLPETWDAPRLPAPG
jgi:predicted metal-dependent hydrolase